MWKRLTVIFAALRSDLKVLWFALQHPQSPGWLKLGVVGLLGYLLLPIDIIPDFIPVIGYLDDVVIITFGVKWLLKKLPQNIRTQAHEKAGVPFGPVVVDEPK
jgi:uncharacterized membrane protein YkvA (DUF1232 family)